MKMASANVNKISVKVIKLAKYYIVDKKSNRGKLHETSIACIRGLRPWESVARVAARPAELLLSACCVSFHLRSSRMSFLLLPFLTE